MTTACSCWDCRFGLGDPVARADHANRHVIFAERDVRPAHDFPPLAADHEVGLLAVSRGLTVRRIDGVCHRMDCPKFTHPVHES